ncbi:MAG: DNA sulfur modification protein DndE [Bacillaceae bacterium]|nr:DNA sulfur modification protein DndE [Bacillaceae bacterium]
MIVKQFTLSNVAKDKLSRLKGKTGITQWNILCRWALCLSLREPTPPPDYPIPADSNVTLEWHTFAGEYHELYESLIRHRCAIDGLGTDPQTLANYFRLHLHRGIDYLAASQVVRNITDLLQFVVCEPESNAGGDPVIQPGSMAADH